MHARRFVEEWDANNAPAAKDSASVQGSQITSSSRDSLYKHFDKLTKTEQVEVLKDALGRKERLQKLETMSDKFDDSALKGLSAQARLCANAVSTFVCVSEREREYVCLRESVCVCQPQMAMSVSV